MSQFIKIINGNPIDSLDLSTTQSLIVVAERMVAEAKSLAPVDLGQLKNSIMYALESSKGGLNDSAGIQASFEIKKPSRDDEAYVGFNLLYGIYQEFGTKYMKPQPFLRLAGEIIVNGRSTIDAIAEINKEQMKLGLKKFKSKEIFDV